MFLYNFPILNIAQNQSFVQKGVGVIYKTAMNLYFCYFKAIHINIHLYIFIFLLYLYYIHYYYKSFVLLLYLSYDLLKSILRHFFILLI